MIRKVLIDCVMFCYDVLWDILHGVLGSVRVMVRHFQRVGAVCCVACFCILSSLSLP